MRLFKPALLVALCCVMASTARGQGAASAAAQAAPSVAVVIDQELSTVEKNTVDLAEAMPDDKFRFTPEGLAIQGSDYKGVRDFAKQVVHIAAANYFFWSTITGDKVPDGLAGANPSEAFLTKEASIKVLKDSFALGHRAIATLTAQNMMDPFPVRQGKQTRLYLATFPIIHANDIYGQMVEYLRMNGKIPPASLPH